MAKETNWLHEEDLTTAIPSDSPVIPQMPIQLTTIMSCEYLLPCGRCDKTDEMCSQYQEVTLHI